MDSHNMTDPPCVTNTRTMMTTIPETIQIALLTILVRIVDLISTRIVQFRILRVVGAVLSSDCAGLAVIFFG